MSRRVPREWSTYRYLDPEKLLRNLRKVETTLPLHRLRPQAASLRTRDLRKFGEGRQAALFCYGIGQVLGVKVRFAQVERGDFDIVAKYELDGIEHFVPIQLKEWVPPELTSTDLQTELDKLNKYVDSSDLVVAFYLNRTTRIEVSNLKLPVGRIAELWFFGAKDLAQSRWHLLGNLLSPEAEAHEFSYPSEA